MNFPYQFFTTPDLPALDILQPPDWPSVKPRFIYYLNHDFCFPIKVEVNNQVVGVGAAIVHGVTGWMAHIIVHPEFQGKGIGYSITATLVDILKAKNCKTISLLATEQGFPVYKKFGFITEAQYTFFRHDHWQPDFVSDTHIQDYSDLYHDAIVKMDVEASAEQRAFRMEEVIRDAKLYIENGKLSGFYLPGFGEGLVVAENTAAGIALSKHRLLSENYSVVPDENTVAMKLLPDLGFKAYRWAKRMRIGPPLPWKPQYIYSRVSGQIG